MTAEQLEELLGKAMQIKAAETYEKIMNAFPGPPIVEYLCRENAHLTRRVSAADRLVEAVSALIERDIAHVGPYAGQRVISAREALTAYREASK